MSENWGSGRPMPEAICPKFGPPEAASYMPVWPENWGFWPGVEAHMPENRPPKVDLRRETSDADIAVAYGRTGADRS